MIKSHFIWFQSLLDGASYSPQFFQKSIMANLVKTLFHFNPSLMEHHICHSFSRNQLLQTLNFISFQSILDGASYILATLFPAINNDQILDDWYNIIWWPNNIFFHFRLRLYSLFHQFFQPLFWFYLLAMTSRADLMINEAVCLTQKKDFL